MLPLTLPDVVRKRVTSELGLHDSKGPAQSKVISRGELTMMLNSEGKRTREKRKHSNH